MKTMLLVIKFLISSMGRVTFSTYLHITEQGREYICCVTDSEPRKALRAWSNGLQGNTSSRVKLSSSQNTALHSSQKQLCKTRWGDVASAHGAEILGIQTWVGTSAWVKCAHMPGLLEESYGICRRGRGTRLCSSLHCSDGTLSYVWLDSTFTRQMEEWDQSGRRDWNHVTKSNSRRNCGYLAQRRKILEGMWERSLNETSCQGKGIKLFWVVSGARTSTHG